MGVTWNKPPQPDYKRADGGDVILHHGLRISLRIHITFLVRHLGARVGRGLGG